jgi:hypothetical protein
MRIMIFMLALFLTMSLASALIMEEGSMLNHGAVYYEFMDDIEFDEVQVLSDRIVLNGEHELKFIINSGELYIKIYSWSGLNHSLGISSSVNQVAQYEILVNGTNHYFKTGTTLIKNNVAVTTDEVSWIYTLEEAQPPRRGGGGDVDPGRGEEVEEPVVEAAFNPIKWLREKYDGLSQEDINFLTFLLILLIFMILITRRKKNDEESWSVNYRG